MLILFRNPASPVMPQARSSTNIPQPTPTLFEARLKQCGIVHKLIKPYNGKVERLHRKDNEYFYATHRFYSFDDFKNQLAVHNRKYNNFPMRPSNWKSPSEYIKAYICNGEIFDFVKTSLTNQQTSVLFPANHIDKETRQAALPDIKLMSCFTPLLGLYTKFGTLPSAPKLRTTECLTDRHYPHFYRGGVCYLSLILDVCTNKVPDYRLSNNLKLDFVPGMVDAMWSKYGAKQNACKSLHISCPSSTYTRNAFGYVAFSRLAAAA